MSDRQPRPDRRPTDEPDGTPAHAASMRPPGESLTPGGPSADEAGGAPADETAATTPSFERPVASPGGPAGYDVDAVSGDTDAVRPD